MSPEFYWVAVVATTIISTSRLTRLVTVDKFPPVKAIREWYENKTDGSDWQWLTLCGYCFSFWAALGVVISGLLCGVYDSAPRGYDDVSFTSWWIFNGIFAAAYLAGVFMAYDGTHGEDDD